MAEPGQFVRAVVSFEENDGRRKPRPIFILAKIEHQGSFIYLAAPGSTKVGKCRGDIEVVLNQDDAAKLELAESTVLRFSRQSLRAVMDKDITHFYGDYTLLSPSLQLSLQHAAKACGCPL